MCGGWGGGSLKCNVKGELLHHFHFNLILFSVFFCAAQKFNLRSDRDLSVLTLKNFKDQRKIQHHGQLLSLSPSRHLARARALSLPGARSQLAVVQLLPLSRGFPHQTSSDVHSFAEERVSSSDPHRPERRVFRCRIRSPAVPHPHLCQRWRLGLARAQTGTYLWASG